LLCILRSQKWVSGRVRTLAASKMNMTKTGACVSSPNRHSPGFRMPSMLNCVGVRAGNRASRGRGRDLVPRSPHGRPRPEVGHSRGLSSIEACPKQGLPRHFREEHDGTGSPANIGGSCTTAYSVPPANAQYAQRQQPRSVPCERRLRVLVYLRHHPAAWQFLYC